MILAPYAVFWAFIFASMVLVNLGVVWLFYHRRIAALFRRLWIADAAAAWLALIAAYHGVYLARGVYREALGDPAGAWVLWGGLAAYLALRVIPGAWRRPTICLALAVILWGWAIGAGYLFIAEMEADRRVLAEEPGAALVPHAAAGGPLARARYFDHVHRQDLEMLEEVLAGLAAGVPLDVGLAGVARLNLAPQLVLAYDLDLRRLATYQFFQIALLAALMAVWGFGTRREG